MYVIASNPLNWTDSNTFCQEIGSNLSSIHSESDFDETRSICMATDIGCWIGLNDIASEGVWLPFVTLISWRWYKRNTLPQQHTQNT